MLFASLRNPSLSKGKKYSRQMLFWLLGIILVAVVVHIGLQYLNLEVYHEKNGVVFELSNRFDLDDEASVMTWVAQLQFLVLGGICALASLLERQKVLKALWVAAAGIACFFSIDETAALHEFVLQRIHVALFQDAKPTLFANSWIIILPFILAFAAFMIWKMFKYLPRRTIGLICVGGVVFLSGAVFVDLITSTTPESPFVSQGIFVAIEESSELFGVALVTYAVASYVEQVYGHRVGKALKQLKD